MKERVDIESETIHHFADHEILLSFYNDSGAEKFHEWWWKEGERLFDEYEMEE